MELESLMQSLSLHSQEDIAEDNLKVTAVQIGEHHTDIVFGDFTNKYMVIATQYENIGSLLRVSIEQPANGFTPSEPIYTVSAVFGCDTEEQQAAARFIAERLKIHKSLLLFLCLKNYNVDTVRSLADAIVEIKTKN